MPSIATTLTASGRTSIPATIRRELGLRPGQRLVWERVSETELLVKVPARGLGRSMRGAMKQHSIGNPRTTAAWMKLLREGEARA